MRICTLIVLMMMLAGAYTAQAQQPQPMSIAVFAFELEDKSAGAGIIPPDEYDKRYLAESAVVAKDMLSKTGRYKVIDMTAGNDQAAEPHKLRYCGGCEGKMAKEHGASLALLGVVTRISRTEHTMFIRILDVETGKPVAEGFTDLRMGANYAWPRSAKWVMTNRILR